MSRFNVLKWGAYALFIIILAVLQMQIPFYPHPSNVTPLFIIPAVISISMMEGETAGGIYGMAGGLFWDAGTGRAFGFNALFLMIIGVAVGLFVKYLFKNTALSAFLFAALFTVTHELTTWFFFCFMTGNVHIGFAFLHTIIPTACVTLIFALPLYFAAYAISSRLTEDDGDSPI